MNNLLTPDEVRKQFAFQDIMRLREDYLTLWDELANERSISDRLLERIAELEKSAAMTLQIVEATRKLREDNEMEE